MAPDECLYRKPEVSERSMGGMAKRMNSEAFEANLYTDTWGDFKEEIEGIRMDLKWILFWVKSEAPLKPLGISWKPLKPFYHLDAPQSVWSPQNLLI